jgi:hypothetical protein
VDSFDRLRLKSPKSFSMKASVFKIRKLRSTNVVVSSFLLYVRFLSSLLSIPRGHRPEENSNNLAGLSRVPTQPPFHLKVKQNLSARPEEREAASSEKSWFPFMFLQSLFCFARGHCNVMSDRGRLRVFDTRNLTLRVYQFIRGTSNRVYEIRF